MKSLDEIALPSQVKRVLITGGAGFIGAHIVRLLERSNIAVTVLDNLSSGKRANLSANTELVVGDVRNTDLVKQLAKGADLVIHLAAIPSVALCQNQVYNSHSVNLGGTMALIEAVRDAAPNAPVIYASTAAVYGACDQLPLGETSPTIPLGFYGLDKLAGEKALQLSCAEFGMRAIALRLFNVYGELQDPSSPYSGVISIFADRMLHRRPTLIFGDGSQTRDFIYVGDVAAHFIAAAAFAIDSQKGTFEALNVATGHPTSVNELYATLAAVLDPDEPPVFEPPRIGDILNSCGDPTRARNTLGLETKTPFATGIAAYAASLAEPSDPPS